MKRRIIRLFIPITSTMILLVGLLIMMSDFTLAATPSAPVAPDDPVTIVYWHPFSAGSRKEFMDHLIDEFNASNPHNITIQGVFAGSPIVIYDEVINKLNNNEPLPNIAAVYPNLSANLARYGVIHFLDDYLNNPTIGITDTTDFPPGVIDSFRLGQYGHQLAGLQHVRAIELMYYNADLLTGAGSAVPMTWDAFETSVISLTSETVVGTIVDTDASSFSTWLWSRGGDLLSTKLDQARFDEQPGIDSLMLFQSLINNNYARIPYGQYEDQVAFGKGEVGFTFGSSSGLPYYRSGMNNGAGHSWGVARVPAIPGQEVVDTYGFGLVVLHHTEEEDRAAWIFIKWLTDREQTARWAAISGQFPVRSSAATHISMTEKLAADPQYAQAHNLLSLGRAEPGIRDYIAVRMKIHDAMVEILANGAGVTSTLQTAAADTDYILAESGPKSAVITPEGGVLSFTNTRGISTTVQFPAGAVGVTQTVSFVPLDGLPTDGFAFALVPDLIFDQPVSITIHYGDEDVVGMDENALKLYNFDWASSTWIDANPCGGYVRDPIGNVFQAAICHFSDYALTDKPHKFFVPVVLNTIE